MTDLADLPTRIGAARPGLRYAEPGARDARLDLIRGYALAAMAVNHFGLHQSYVHTVSGRSSFLISAAEVFLFVSGYTLGFISFGRPERAAIRRLANRTWTVYLATIAISLGLSAVAMTTTLQLWGEFEPEAHTGPLAWLIQVLTLRDAFNGADILIAYVVYLGVGVGALALLQRGRTAVVVLATGALYLAGSRFGVAEDNAGVASFRALLPNAPLFFGGLVLGYHRTAIDRWWQSLPARPVPVRSILDGAVIIGAVGLGLLHARGWPVLTGLGSTVTGGELEEPLGVREFEMPFGALAVVGLYLRAIWLVADRVWGVLRPALGSMLLPLGRAGLFTFVMHLVAIPLVVNLPGFPDEEGIGRAAATLWVALFLAVIWVAVALQARAGAWLDAKAELGAGIRRARPLALTGVLTLAMFGAGFTVAADRWDGELDIDDAEFDDEFDEDAEFDEDEFEDGDVEDDE